MAVLTLREAVRTRLLAALLVLLAIIQLGLPILIRGDGTPEGLVEVFITYTLGLSMAVLTAATLWTACGSIALDIRDRRMPLLISKPLHKGDLWIGKWLGILILNGSLLALCGATTYIQLHRRLAALALPPGEQIRLERETLTANRRLTPRPENVEAEAARRLAEGRATGWEGADLPENIGLAIMRKSLISERSAVAPGATRHWTFDIPKGKAAARPAMLRVHLASLPKRGSSGVGRWDLQYDGQAAAGHAVVVTNLMAGISRLRLPIDALPSGTVTLSFTNHGGPDDGSVIFDPMRGVEVLIGAGGFGSNLLRAWLIQFAQLAAIAAVGLAASALFSMPVAVFLASSLLVMAFLGHSFTAAPEEAYGIRSETTGRGLVLESLERFGRRFMDAYSVISDPLVASNPLIPLVEGTRIPWGEVARLWGIGLGLYPVLLGALSALALSRRELEPS